MSVYERPWTRHFSSESKHTEQEFTAEIRESQHIMAPISGRIRATIYATTEPYERSVSLTATFDERIAGHADDAIREILDKVRKAIMDANE